MQKPNRTALIFFRHPCAESLSALLSGIPWGQSLVKDGFEEGRFLRQVVVSCVSNRSHNAITKTGMAGRMKASWAGLEGYWTLVTLLTLERAASVLGKKLRIEFAKKSGKSFAIIKILSNVPLISF